MTREEYNKAIQDLWKTNYNFHEECRFSIDIKEKYILSLEVKIDAQEIIIKDKTAFMEAMAQPKTCNGCIHYSNQTAFGQWCKCARNTSEDEYFDAKLYER